MYRLTPLLLLLSMTLHGQSINKGPETNFAFKVKQIDEFINRFNHAPFTLAVRQNPGLTHRANLYSLFNAEDKHWDMRLVKKFVEE